MRLRLIGGKAAYLPSRSLGRFGLWALLPFAVVSIGAFLMLPRLSFTGNGPNVLIPNDNLMRDSRAFGAHFAEPSYVTILYRVSPLYSPSALQGLAHLGRVLVGLPDVASVLSAANVKDLVTHGNEIGFSPVYTPESTSGGGDIAGLEKTITGTPLFHSFLVSKDGRAFVLYVFPKKSASGDRLAAGIEAAVHRASVGNVSLVVVGEPTLEYQMERAGARDLLVLGLISLLVALILQSLFARSLRIGLVLLLSSIVPSLWTIALFPLLGVAMNIYTTVVPLVVIALSTSYGIHLYRRLREDGAGDMASVLDSITPIVVAAASTTMLGFASISFVPIRILRTLGLMAIPGILFALLTSLFMLPPLLAAASRSLLAEREQGGSARKWRVPPYLGSHPVLVLALLAGGLVVLAVGTSRIPYDYRAGVNFRPGSLIGARYLRYGEENGGLQQLVVAVDTGKEYGLVDPAVFRGVAAVAESARSFSPETTVLAFPEFIRWIESRLSTPASGGPITSEKIGEDLEMLFSSHSGLRIDSLVDPAYRRTRLIIYFGNNTESAVAATARLRRLETRILTTAQRELPKGTDVRLYGEAMVQLHQERYLIRSEIYSGLSFFAVLFLLLSLLFRSFRWPLLVLMPPIAGLFFYFGLLGWSGSSFSPFTVFMVSIIMGVGNDDVLFFVLSYRTERKRLPAAAALRSTAERTGRAIVQTTIVLAGALCVLGLSQFTYAAREGPLGAATLVVCTIATYVAVPAVLSTHACKESS